jgi:hypothetical protein
MKTIIVITCLFVVVSCTTAFGQGWNYYPANWNGCYSHGSYACDYVPYYAMHPPVYYSYHTARTYGDSPYPYPPGISALQQAFSAITPQIIKNEYAGEDSSMPGEQSVRTIQPLRISNPFVEQTDKSTMSKGVKWGEKKATKPLIVYPTANIQASN